MSGQADANQSKGAAPSALPAWSATLDRDHPLVGRIWSVRSGRFVEERELRASLRGYVLLGEKHDNPDHHTLQARLIDAMVLERRRPVVAFEMLELDAQPRIDAARAVAPADPDAVARAVGWERSGWPDFAMYRPVVRSALATSFPLVATGLAPAKMRAIVRDGMASDVVPTALDDEQTTSLREELVATHCGHLPASMVEGMSRAQRARDATMAREMRRALPRTGATDVVLIAGTGHVRRDRGVPLDLVAHDPSRPVVSVGFVEVERTRAEPNAYADHWNVRALPFDFVWFTPRVTDEDPCAGMGD